MIVARLVALILYVAAVGFAPGWVLPQRTDVAIALVAAGLALELAASLAGEARARA